MTIDVQAKFEGAPGQQFPLQFKEAATRADPQTRTFEVTYQMPAPDTISVLPGMTATVEVNLGDYAGESLMYMIPVQAVVADNDLNSRVWVIDEATGKVSAREIEVAYMAGHRVTVRSGLEKGDRIVLAGAPYLSDGMKVRIMEASPPAADDAAGTQSSGS